MAFARTVFSLLVAFIWSQRQVAQSEEENYLLRPNGYKAKEIPISPKGSPPFAVSVDLSIWSITEVSLQRQHMEVDLIVTVQWIDDRLTLHPNISNSIEWVLIGKEINSIWSPTLIFENCKGCSRITFKSNSHIPVSLYVRTGRLYAEVRKLWKFSCNIDLRYYPMDVQNCPIQIFTDEDYSTLIVLKHNTTEVTRTITSNITMSEFSGPLIHAGECTNSVTGLEGYSCLELRVRFERLLGFHMTTFYLPTTFIVVLSWISFWFPADVIPARVAIGLTSLLTLATRLDQAQRDLPPVSYTKAIDVWILTCIFLVSLSLLEFAVCNHMLRSLNSCVRKPKTNTGVYKNRLKNKIRLFLAKPRKRILPFQHQDADRSRQPEDVMLCDRVSRVVFPASFILFNVVYWIYYLSSSSY